MHFSRVILGVLLTLVILCVVQCNQAPDPRTPSTRQMVDRLEEIADTAQRIVSLPEQLSGPSGRARRSKKDPYSKANRKMSRAQKLLYSGSTKAAVRNLQKLRRQVQNNEVYGFGTDLTEINELLAASYLRLGQEHHCLAESLTAACLFPIREKGVYEHQESSHAAIELYSDILRRTRKNVEARWLLNIAHMSVGGYPGEIADSLRLPPAALASEHEVDAFTDVASEAGLAERGRSGGSVVEDFDGDGDLDVMASSWGLNDQLRFYENTGDGTYRDRTVEAGLEGMVGGLNLVPGDFNNDGAVDVLVLRGAWKGDSGRHPNSLLRNNGDGSFSDVTARAGLLSFHPTQTAAWADYNNDGWLDLFIGNETSPGSRHACELYRNNGDGTFTNVAASTGLDVHGFVKGATWGDYNNDGRSDLYLSRLGEPNLLFRNEGPQSGGWTFTEASRSAGVRKPLNSFPTWFWDYNNDGRLDLFVSGFGPGYVVDLEPVLAEYLGDEPERVLPRLYKNEGNGEFRDVTDSVHLDRVLYGMGANYGDINSDGFPDLYVGTGGPHFTSLIPNRLFRNAGGSEFQDVTSSARVGHLGKGHGVSFGDVDNDGDQDLFTVLGGAMPGDTYRNALFQNPGHDHHWIGVSVEGTQSNAVGIGARIKVVVETSAGLRDIHTMVSSGGSFGASSFRQHVGLGEATAIESLEIRWPASGRIQTFRDVEMDQFYRVVEGRETLVPLSRASVDNRLTGAWRGRGRR